MKTICFLTIIFLVNTHFAKKYKSGLKKAYDSAFIDAGIQIKKYPKTLQVHFDNLKVTRPGEVLNPRYSKVLMEQPTYRKITKNVNISLSHH